MGDDGAGGIELVGALRQVAQRQQVAVEVADLVLVRLAHVEDEDVFTGVELPLQFLRLDFRHRHRGLRLFAADAAELVVVNQFRQGRLGAAGRAVGVLAELQLAELHLQRVKDQQTPLQRLAGAEDELDGFVRLNRADDAGQHSEHAAFGAARHQPGRGRLGIEAAVAGAVRQREDRRLPFEAEDAAVDVGLAEQHAGVVDEIARGEVVGAVRDDVVRAEDVERVLARELGRVQVNLDFRVEVAQAFAGGFELRPAHVLGAEGDLPLEVRKVDDVEVHQAQPAHAGGRQIQPERRPQPARADEQHFRRLELELPLHPHLGHDEVAAVAQDFLRRQRRRRRLRLLVVLNRASLAHGLAPTLSLSAPPKALISEKRKKHDSQHTAPSRRGPARNRDRRLPDKSKNMTQRNQPENDGRDERKRLLAHGVTSELGRFPRRRRWRGRCSPHPTPSPVCSLSASSGCPRRSDKR